MTSINNQDEMTIASASAQATSTGRRVVLNKATDLASKGSAPWDDTQRQALVDNHAIFETWGPVADLLERSNQALRSEWKKMRDGDRENGGNWQEKVKACEARREMTFPSRGSGTRRSGARPTTTTAPPATTAGLLLISAAGPLLDSDVSGVTESSSAESSNMGTSPRRNPPRGRGRVPRRKPLGPPTGLSWQEIAADLRAMGIYPSQRTRRPALRHSLRA